MKMNLRTGILAAACVVIVFAVSGCGRKSAAVKDPSALPTLDATATKIAARVSQLNLYDERSSRSPAGRILHMPEITIVGQIDRIRPPLTDAARDMIDDEARSFFISGSRSVTLDIYVVEAMQRFEVVEMKEIVVVEFAIRIELADDKNSHDVRTAEGSSKLTYEATDITREKLAEMYTEAIQESVRDGFEHILAALR